jgi:hypothetical protein
MLSKVFDSTEQVHEGRGCVGLLKPRPEHPGLTPQFLGDQIAGDSKPGRTVESERLGPKQSSVVPPRGSGGQDGTIDAEDHERSAHLGAPPHGIEAEVADRPDADHDPPRRVHLWIAPDPSIAAYSVVQFEVAPLDGDPGAEAIDDSYTFGVRAAVDVRPWKVQTGFHPFPK